MTTSDMVRQLCKESHVSLSELARRVGQSPQNFSKKLQRETLTLEELKLIGEALSVNFEQSFILATGRRISTAAPENYAGLPDRIGGVTALPSDHPLRKALTGDYNTAIYVDGPTGHCTFYTLPDDVKNCFGKVLDRNPGVGIVSSLLIDNYVAAEDRQEVSTVLEINSLRDTLMHTPVVSKVFRRITENGEKYNELRIIRIGEADKLQGAVIAIIDRDAMIREKIENDAMSRKLLAVTDSLASACSFVVSVNMKDDMAWICRISKFIHELYGNIEKTDVPFRNVMLPVLMRDVHPDDISTVEKALSDETVREKLAVSHEYYEGFRYKYNDRYYYVEMRISRYGDGFDADSFVLSFLNRDKEIRSAETHRDELIAAREKAEKESKAKTECINEIRRSLRSSLDDAKDYKTLAADVKDILEKFEA